MAVDRPDDRFARRTVRGPGATGRPPPTRNRIESEVARHRLGRWDVAGPLIQARLVPRSRAGPLARRAPLWRPSVHPSALAIDLGLDVGPGIVLVDCGLVGAWGQPADRVWAAALANRGRRPDPPLAEVPDRRGLWICSDGPMTTGAILQPERLRRRMGDTGSARRPGPLLALAPCPDLLILASDPTPRPDPSPPGPTGGRATEVVAEAVRLAEVLTAGRSDRLPMEVLGLRSGTVAFTPAGGLE